MLFKRNAISSLMLELDSDDEPQSGKNATKNFLAQEIVELTNIPASAKKIVEYEKGIIELRGNDPSDYLMNDALTVSDVLRYFYRNVYYEDNGIKRIKPNLSISELMIMLGVFKIITDFREREIHFYESELTSIKRKTEKKFGYYVRRKNGLEKLDGYLNREETLTRNIQEEENFREIVIDNLRVIEQEIIRILSFKSEEKTKENIDRIYSSSKTLARSYTRIEDNYKRRKKLPISLLADVLLLENSGEYIDVLTRVYELNSYQYVYKM